MPSPPPRSSSGSSTPCSSRTCGEQPDDAVRRDLEAGRVEDLRADVRVQADAARSPGSAARGRTASRRLAAGEREAELLVLVRGRDELVGVRLDADRDAHQHRLPRRPRSRAAAASRSISSTSRRRPGRPRRPRARSSSAIDLLLPCKRSAPAANPPRSATASSPPVQTSSRQPSSSHPARHRATGTPCPRSTRRRRRRTPTRPGTPRREPGSRPRPGRSAGVPYSRRQVPDVVPADAQRTVGVAAHRGRPDRRDRGALASSGWRQPGRPADGPPPCSGPGLCERHRLHPLGGGDAEQAEAVREHLAGSPALSHSRVRCRSVTGRRPSPGSTRHAS